MYKSLIPGAVGIQLPFDEAAALAANHGFEGISIDLGFLEKEGPDKVRAILDEHALRPGAFGLPVPFREGEKGYDEALERLPQHAQRLADLGARHCSTYILPWSDTMPFDDNLTFHRDRLRPAAAILAEYDIALGLEFVGPYTLRAGKAHPFIYDIPGMLQLTEAIGTGNVGLLVDCFHLYTSHGTLDDLRKLTAEQVVDVHINDAAADVAVDEQLDHVRALPGETGVIDVTGFLTVLAGIGYDGPVGVEPFSPRLSALPPQEAAAETAASVRQVWPQS